MASTWWSITVELVSGRGEYFWPRPGRVLIARPGWTFRVLADAINRTFGRRELAHLHAFTLADGTRITMPDPWGEDFGGLDDTSTKLTRLQAGEVFAFTFDYGDGWDHLCTVGHAKVDAEQVAGIVPHRPIPIFGWGALPDQHGRVWSGDDGSGWVPPQPDPPAGDLPRILHDWGPRDVLRGPAAEEVADELAVLRAIRMDHAQPWDDAAVSDLRGAVARRDLGLAERLLSARDVGDVVQQAAPVLILLARRRSGASRALCRQAIDALHDRGWPGDRELAIELTADLGEGRDLMSVPVPVDLDVLASELDRNPVDVEGGWYLDLRDGSWVCGDESLTGEPVPEDLDDDERWLQIEPHDRNEEWHDMSLFIEYVHDGELAAHLDEAISGRGAFRRFGDTLRHHEEEWQRWHLFREERALGRARLWLEMRDFRPEV